MRRSTLVLVLLVLAACGGDDDGGAIVAGDGGGAGAVATSSTLADLSGDVAGSVSCTSTGLVQGAVESVYDGAAVAVDLGDGQATYALQPAAGIDVQVQAAADGTVGVTVTSGGSTYAGTASPGTVVGADGTGGSIDAALSDPSGAAVQVVADITC